MGCSQDCPFGQPRALVVHPGSVYLSIELAEAHTLTIELAVGVRTAFTQIKSRQVYTTPKGPQPPGEEGGGVGRGGVRC